MKILSNTGLIKYAVAAVEADTNTIPIKAMINSMTKKERENPDLLNNSRKRRIAKGSGTTVQDVNRLLKSYEEMLRLLKKMKKPGKMQMFLRKFFGM